MSMSNKEIKGDLAIIKNRLNKGQLVDNQEDNKLISVESDYASNFPLGSPERDMLQDKIGVDFPLLEEQQWLQDQLKTSE